MSSQQPFNTLTGAASGASSGAGPGGGMQPPGAGGQPQAGQQGHIDANRSLVGCGEVVHIDYLSDDIGALFLQDEYSDVTLVVHGERFDAHRVILAARSDYFRALLYGGMRESQLTDVELRDTPLQAFKHLLRYIYTGQMSLAQMKEDLTLDILGLAHQYGFLDLERSICDYLRAILNLRNVCLIYDMASLYGLEELMTSCLAFVDRHATEIIKDESFTSLSATGVHAIISRDSFCAPEVEIFRAVHDWVNANPAEVEQANTILSALRLSLMSTLDLLKVVRPTNLVPPDVMLDAIQSKTESRDMELRYRGYLIPEENVAQPKHAAQVIVGEVKHALLDGDSKNYDMERGFARHPIVDEGALAATAGQQSSERGIVIKLGMQCIINHLRMLLWDRDQRAYSYYIEVSMDQKDWVRVIDHTKYYCRSWQELYFSPRVVRFIRVVGTHNTVNRVFHVVSLEAYYTKKPFQFDPNGILIPRHNVATIGMSACVIEGVCRSRNALLNGDTSTYDWDSGYTCHQLGSGSIVVQLGQPYALSSMRLLLWDCDERSYSYYIETSVNQKNWEVVCDRSREACKSWQMITFQRRPVVYIRIVGTHNTANEVFHCVHFECPASTERSTSRKKKSGSAAATGAVASSGISSRPGSPSPHSNSSLVSNSSSSESSSSSSEATRDAVASGGDRETVSEVDRASSSHQSSPASFSSSTAIPFGGSASSIIKRQQQQRQQQWPALHEFGAVGGVPGQIPISGRSDRSSVSAVNSASSRGYYNLPGSSTSSRASPRASPHHQAHVRTFPEDYFRFPPPPIVAQGSVNGSASSMNGHNGSQQGQQQGQAAAAVPPGMPLEAPMPVVNLHESGGAVARRPLDVPRPLPEDKDEDSSSKKD